MLCDAEGTIQGANAAAERLSGFSRLELVGAPLSMITDGSMPMGVERLVQDHLSLRRPTGAYVKRVSKDADPYWLFEIWVPYADYVVIVGFPPTQNDYLREIRRIYSDARTLEQTLLLEGASATTAQSRGAELMERNLIELGFADYSDLLRTVIPVESTEMGAHFPLDLRALAVPPGAYRAGVDAVLTLDSTLSAHRDADERLFEISAALVSAAEGLLNLVELMREAAQNTLMASQQVAGATTMPLTVAHRIRAGAEESAVRIRALTSQTDSAQSLILDLRMRLAIAQLLTQVMGDFMARLLVDPETSDDLSALPFLLGGLDEGTPAASMLSARISASLSQVARDSSDTAGRVRSFASVLASWHLLVPRFDLPTGLIPDDLNMDDAATRLDGMRDIARGSEERGNQFDPAMISEPSGKLMGALRALGYL
jgi:aerotaxis receptor